MNGEDNGNDTRNGNSDIARDMIMDQARRAETAVRNADYSKCPVPGQQAAMVFLVSGMKVLLGKELQHSHKPKYQRLLLHPHAKVAYIVTVVVAIKDLLTALFTSKPPTIP